jgi:hypothetical protein
MQGPAQHSLASMTHTLQTFLGHFHIIHQHHIALCCPQHRQEAHIVTQLPTGMGRSEVAQIGSQRNIVFRIENSYCHSVNLQFTNRFCLMTND